MICPRCSSANPAENQFCGECGARLSETAAGFDTLDRIGQVLEGKYRLVRMIGMGAAGAVYRAEIEGIGQTVAMKILHPDITSDPQARARLENEARLASLIDHPNIVSIIDMHSSTELTYLVMEYLSGVSLDEVLAEVGYLGVRRSIHIVRQLLSALETSHKHGVLHRDLKPDNIFLTLRHDRLDFVKVLDFGLATLKERPSESRITVEGYVCGTPGYMAPEQVRNMNLSERSDLYSVGVLLYECLTGDNPFIGSTTVDTLVNQVTLMPKPPSSVRKEAKVPLYLDALVMRALNKDPMQRFSSAQEFRVVLEGLALAQAAKEEGLRGTCNECGNVLGPSATHCEACGQATVPLPEVARTEVDKALTPEVINAFDQADPREFELSPTTTTTAYRSVGWDPPLVGRTEELERIRSMFERSARPTSQRFLRVLGGAGQGKGRIAREAAKLATTHGWRVVWSSQDLLPIYAALYPIQRAVSRLLRLDDEASTGERTQRRQGVIFGDEAHVLTMAEKAGYDMDHRQGLLELFGLAEPGKDSAAERRLRRALAWRQVVQCTARREPLQLVFQDLDLFDGPSQELVASLVTRESFENPVNVLVTHDPSLLLLWAETETMSLPALSSSEARELATMLFQRVGLNEKNVDTVLAISGGSPMMLIELVRLLAIDPSIRPARSLAEVINQRISRLPTKARRLLYSTAVLGRPTNPNTLVNVLETEPSDELRSLTFLAEQGFLIGGSQGWRPSHRLHWEVAYNAIPAARRQQLHAKAAQLAMSEGEPSALMAHHLLHSPHQERAVPYLLRAGRRALYFLDEQLATELFNQVLRIVPTPPSDFSGDRKPWVRATMGLAQAMVDGGDTTEALRVYKRALITTKSCKWDKEHRQLAEELTRLRAMGATS
jgi:serine/threonine protein kinase